MDIREFIESNIENMKADLGKLVSYNSVEADDAKPFGLANQKVLDEALSMMKDKGLETKNLDYYCGYGQVGDKGKTIGILAHLDIVPAGEGWNSDPFTMVEKDGFLYGRGVSDDKGAAIASLYAIKYLLDEKYEFRNKVRLILGCNEESGSACVRHYVEVEGDVDCGFTPDGNFPGIYAEKGMMGGKIVGHNSKIIDIKGGEAPNVVCKKCNAKLPLNSFDLDSFKSYLDEKDMQYDIAIGDVIDVTVYGVAAHASTPDLGKNAFSHMMEALYASKFDDSFVSWFHNWFALTNHGELLGYEDIKDDISNTSINFGLIGKDGNDVCASLDMRFPVKANKDAVIALMDKCHEEENEFVMYNAIDPLYFDRNTPFIKALKKTYEDVSGDKETEMEAIGGGTYAKAMHNIIAFGCEFIGDDNHIHDANECLNIEGFKKQVEMYVEAIKNLDQIED